MIHSPGNPSRIFFGARFFIDFVPSSKSIIFFFFFISFSFGQKIMFYLSLQIQSDLQYIKEDIHAAERRRIELYRRRDRHSAKMRMLVDDPTSKSVWPSLMDKHTGAIISRTDIAPGQGRMIPGGSQNRKTDVKPSASPLSLRKDASGSSDTQNLTQSGLALARKRRVHALVSYLLLESLTAEMFFSKCK